jgi:hypothetical protein
LVLVLSDCVGPEWRSGLFAAALARWAEHQPVAILQPLPQSLWGGSAIGGWEPVQVAPPAPGTPNRALRMTRNDWRLGEREGPPAGVPVVVVPLIPRPLGHWAGLVAGRAGIRLAAFVPVATASPGGRRGAEEPAPEERLRRFRRTASPTAMKLAGHLAACPVLTPPVMRLIQWSVGPRARTDHLAEVLLGGLLRCVDESDESGDPDQERYEFQPGVRALLLDTVTPFEAARVLERVSDYITTEVGAPWSFRALLAEPGAAGPDADGPFARLAADVLARLGGRYAELATRLGAPTEGGSEPRARGDRAMNEPTVVRAFRDWSAAERDTEHLLLAAHRGEPLALLRGFRFDSGSGQDEVDLILINARGVWALDVRPWPGHIDADATFWRYGDRRHPSPVTRAQGKAENLAWVVGGLGLPDVPVVGLVVLTGAGVGFGRQPPEAHKRHIVYFNDTLITAVRGQPGPPAAPALTANLIRALADRLAARHLSAVDREVGGYRLALPLPPVDGRPLYEARHVRSADRKALVKQYDLHYATADEFDAERRRAEWNFRVLTLLDRAPHAVRAFDFVADMDRDDRYWLVFERTERGSLAEALDRGPALTIPEQLRLTLGAARAVEACHRRGVLHLNLQPQSAHLTRWGEIKLSDFDWASIPDLSAPPGGSPSPPRGRHSAPELIAPGGVGRQADLYGLGALGYATALPHARHDPIDPAMLAAAGLPGDMLTLLRSLLETDPARRPASVGEVLTRLRELCARYAQAPDEGADEGTAATDRLDINPPPSGP